VLLLRGETLVRVGAKPDIGASPSGALYRVGMMLPTTALVSTLYSGLPAEHPAHQSQTVERCVTTHVIINDFLSQTITRFKSLHYFVYCYTPIVNTNFRCMLCHGYICHNANSFRCSSKCTFATLKQKQTFLPGVFFNSNKCPILLPFYFSPQQLLYTIL
jgi:hypothetical protein